MNRYVFSQKQMEPSAATKALEELSSVYMLIQADYIVEHGKKPTHEELAKHVVKRMIKQKF